MFWSIDQNIAIFRVQILSLINLESSEVRQRIDREKVG